MFECAAGGTSTPAHMGPPNRGSGCETCGGDGDVRPSADLHTKLEAQASASEHEHEVLRIELTRSREEARGLRELQELWAGASADNVGLQVRLDRKDLEAREELHRVRGQLTNLHAMLETELLNSLVQFRAEYHVAALEQVEEESCATPRARPVG
jgi:hypothetical protein